MMVPFDGSGGQQQPGGVSGPPLPQPPMPPGHQGQPSPVGMPPQHHHQQMNPGFHPGSQRRHSQGMPGQPFPPMPQGSPAGGRQGSFSSMPGGPHQSQYSSHPPLHSPASQQQQPGMHGNMGHPQQMRRTSGPMHQQMGMPPQMAQHDSMRHQSGGHQQQYVNRSMSNSMGNPNMGNSMGSNSMGGSMGNSMGGSTGNSMGGGGGGSGGGSGGNTGWQSDKDTPHRREMIQHIVKLLKKDKNGSPESLNKLPQMAKQLEVSLYRNARSFKEYREPSTLKQRLQQIAVEVSRKARGSSQSGDQRDQRHYTERQQQPPPAPQQQFNNAQFQQQRQSSSSSPFMGNSGSQHNQMQGGRQVNMDDINPMAGGNSMSGSNRNSQGYSSGSRSGQDNSQRGSSSGGVNKNDPDWKVRIRHKQQRLLLLHHSAKCPHEDGRCTVTPHCADMKRLWRHMEGCKDNNCRVSHCFSSRAILSHYRKCKDPACPACGPVRDTVKKSQPNRTPSQGRSRSSGPGGQQQNTMMNNMMMNPIGTSMGNQSMGNSIGGSIGNSMGGSMPNTMNNSMGGSMGNSMGGSMNRGMSSSGQPMMPGPEMGSTPTGGSYNSSSGNYPQNRQSSSMPPPPQGQNGPNQFPMNSSSSSRHRQSSGSNGAGLGSGAQMFDNSGRPSSDSQAMPSSSSRMNDPTASVTLPPPPAGSSGSKRNDSEWQKVRHKQQRLLLLRHASRCHYEAGKCPVTPHCASMKELWKHIAHCKDQQCSVQHCMSSRYVLSHYRRCKDAKCPACGPVRETIRKSSDKKDSGGSSSTRHAGNTSFDIDMSRSNRSSSQSNKDKKGALVPTASSVSPSYGESEPKRPKISHPGDQVAPPMESTSSSAAIPVAQPTPEPPISSSAGPEQVKLQAPNRVRTGGSAKPTKPNVDRSLLRSFTVKELETHLASLNRQTQLPPAKLKSKCLEVLKGLQTHQHGWVFNIPVDPEELGLPDYFEIIKKPMDLGTIHKKLDAGAYHAIEDFAADTNMTFDNAMTYNEEGSVVYDMAKELKVKFEADYKKLLSQLEAEDKERRENDRACTLCGCEKLLFEPPVFFCNGMNCQSQRIRRNSHFYVGGNSQYFWCNQCYNELDDKVPIELVDMTIQKADLVKKKNDEVHEESWVQCDACERWVHQICGLFNSRQNKEHHSEYCCPQCLLEKRQANKIQQSPKPLGAADLPRTNLSEFLEMSITARVEKKKRELAELKAQTENIPLEESLAYVLSGGPIIIRQVTAMDRKLEVRELMHNRYKHKKYPEEFPFRCKCLVVFQELDGVDTILFALYVYEHDDKNPAPNQRCVYISYLDSVHFMRPRRIRTFVYHEILIAYLDYARRRGFATAHIWACPPLKGDDYIFYAKPEDQKTPRDSRLRQWYIDMLIDCQRRSVVGKVTNMYDLYFADESLDATAVPYLEGDYFPGEAENIIKMLEDGGGKKGGSAGKKSKKKGTNKSRGGTRSGGIDEAALLDSGLLGSKALEELDRDQVMVKLGETIQPMKDSFIVAFLNWTGAKEEDMVVPDDIVKYRKENEDKHKDTPDLCGSKRDAAGELRGMLKAVDKNGNPVKVIDDDAEDLDCEFLNNRQAFLNLCRGNHYQFDELRRAKHTSMMVLWHLHNRDAPKFVQQCVSCSREILSGKRYHCNSCPDYDLCEECYKDPKVNRGACTHKLVPIAVETSEQDSSSGGSNLTEAQRQQRQRNLMLHIQLIEHASRCKNAQCSSSNCAKMKNYLQHARVCKVKVQGGCKICKRIWTLLRIHAQKCKEQVCPIPQCMAIREKMRQLQKQQQAMDDRRRMEMNRHFRMNMAGGGGGG